MLGVAAVMARQSPLTAPDAALRAVIDIGSNTVRLVIYGGPPRAPVTLFNEKVTARLGKGVAETGMISAKAWDQARAALARYAALLEASGVARVDCVATAAARDAANGGAFLADITTLGLRPRLLSGEQEALTSAQGVIGAFPGARGVVADLGGGSLELVDIDGDTATHGSSVPLGTLRLAKLRAEGGKKFAQKVHRLLAGADWAGEHNQPLYLVGGSLRALARLSAEERGWPVDDPHGYTIGPDEALSLARRIGRGRPVPAIRGVSSGRLGSLPDVAALLGVLVRELRPSQLVFSSWGLREGLLVAGLSREELRSPPLLAGVNSFVTGHGVTAATADAFDRWVAPVVHEPTPGHAAVRLAALKLGLAAQRIEPNLREDAILGWALRKRWIGIDAEGRGMLGAALLANAGRTALPPELARLASAAALRDAVAWGLALRLGRRLVGPAIGQLADFPLSVAGGDLVLTVPPKHHDLIGEPAVRDLASLAGWLNLEPLIARG